MLIFACYFIPAAVLSAVAIVARRLYPAPEGKLSSLQYRVTKTLPVWWMLGFYSVWYFFAGGSGIGTDSAALRFLVLVGLAAGVAGDFFLLFRKLFLPGFTAFALGHVLYVYGFATVPWVLSWPIIALVFVPGLIYAPIIVRRSERKKMLPLILFYLVLINTMLLTAINASLYAWSASGDELLALPWKIVPRGIPYCITAGAALFCVSDACWAWNRFVKPFPNAGVAILATYYGGQALIVWGAMQYPV